MKKRMLVLVLALVMVLSLLPFGASAAEIVDSGKCGKNVTWTLDSNGLVTISGTGAMADYDAYDMTEYRHNGVVSPFMYAEDIYDVVIQDGVTSVGEKAFKGCRLLMGVTIPDSVTSIGLDAFFGTELSSLELPDSVTSIGPGAFDGCDFSDVTIPKSVTSIGAAAFSENHNLQSVTILGNVTTIEYNTFSYCTSLQTVSIPSTVTKIGENAFLETHVKDVYFDGTEEQWENVRIEYGNDRLLYATVHYADVAEQTTPPEPSKPTTKSPFKDVKKDAYYFDSVLWAVNHDPVVTAGTDATHFSPNNDCTRAQMVTFLWRAAGEPKPASTKNPFKDVKKGAYYYDAVLWAVGEGITAGTSQNTFSPDDTVIRGQTVTFLWRMADQPTVKAKNPFKDVKSSAYYYDAVLWAVKNNITAGTSANAFSPNDSCTRAQIVTFLYRDLG